MAPFFIPNSDKLLKPSTGYGDWGSAPEVSNGWRDAARWPEDLLTFSNRLVRTRMPGGVAGARLTAVPMPIKRFGLRKASHGMSISRTQMCSDAAYAQQQIAHAREMDDTALHELADRLTEVAGAGAVPTPITGH